jgi:beta-lactamase class A
MNELKRRIVFALLGLFTIATVQAQQELPLEPKDSIPAIYELNDYELDSILRTELCKNKKWSRMIDQNKMSIGIVDLSDLEDIKYAGVNDTYMMYAASLPKIAILLAVMDALEEGDVEDTPELQYHLRMMISKSNNRSSTKMIDLVGYERIESVLRGPKHKLYDEEVGGGLWVGKRYAAAGRRYPEPLKGLSHAATTRQVCSFYYQLVMGNLISTERSEQMLDIMKDPALRHKFVNTLSRIAPNATLYRKSGSWRNFHSDSILVWGPNRQYIMVALIDDSYGEQVIRNLVEPIERVLKKAKDLS